MKRMEKEMSLDNPNQYDRSNKGNKIWRRILTGLTIFVGVGALGGGGLAIIVPDGSLMSAQAIIPELQKIPLVGQYLDSLFIPGCALLLFIFFPQIIAGILLLRKHPKQYLVAIISGVLLEVFTIVEIIFLPNFLSWIYLFFGAVEITTAFMCITMSGDRLPWLPHEKQ